MAKMWLLGVDFSIVTTTVAATVVLTMMPKSNLKKASLSNIS